jgi:hypothetical protein
MIDGTRLSGIAWIQRWSHQTSHQGHSLATSGNGKAGQHSCHAEVKNHVRMRAALHNHIVAPKTLQFTRQLHDAGSPTTVRDEVQKHCGEPSTLR